MKTTGDSAGRQRWPGGYVRDGVHVIERKIDGVKFHKSTRCTSLRAALKQLERFEADPRAYRASGGLDGDVLVLNEKMVDEFFEWHLPQVSRDWALNVKSVLIDWANHLAGADLRTLELGTLKRHVDAAPQAHHRVKAIRKLFGWLREVKMIITRAQDITLDLPVPIVAPRQDTGESKAITWEDFVKVVPLLQEDVRDVAVLLGATGWHISEVRRFAESGTVRARRATDAEQTLGVIGTWHKGKSKHFVALVQPEHFEAAKRIRERGHVIGNRRLWKHLTRACDEAGVGRWTLGDLRASAGTWLTQDGVALADSSRYLGHKSPVTTRKFYVDQEAAPVALPARALRVVR